MTVEQILEMLRNELKSWRDPGTYMEEEWYIKCAAKADVLEEMIARIEQSIRV